LIDPFVPARMRAAAIREAESWVNARLNGEDGLGAIFPAMVNAVEAMVTLGYAPNDPRLLTAKRALKKLLVISGSSAYCQPCVSPIWDTALACLALQETGDDVAHRAVGRALDWLQTKQLLNQPGDWQVNREGVAGGGWAFQFANDYYPDLDDTAVVLPPSTPTIPITT
jgi:squalene-hopene/tetraprenyl-beta-curcumene cyclase